MRDVRGLKEFVQILEGQGELQRIKEPLDPRYEISSVLSEIGRREGPALLFESVKGCSTPLVGNLLGTNERIALALGVQEEDIREGRLPNMERRIPPVLLGKKSERELISSKKNIHLRRIIPALTYYIKDSGPYITAGITSARDPRDGTMGRGLHRMEMRGESEIGISLINPPLSDIYAYHRGQGTRMEVATALGVDPSILFATIQNIPRGTDKFAFAGGLMGEAIATQKAETVDVEVPAYAEIIIEGIIDPRGEENDGTLGEASGYYMAFSSSPTIHVTAVSYRKHPCFQAILPWSLEVDHLVSLFHGLDFIPKMKRDVPNILDVHFVPGTFGSHVVFSIDSENKADIRRALTLALTFTRTKKATAVDADVNPRDHLEVEWAMATRFQADRDLIVIPSLRGQPIDPSTGPGFATSKVGIDATKPNKEAFEKVDFPEDVKDRMSSLIADIVKEGWK